MQNSKPFTLNKEDAKHIGRHMLYAAAAGAISYALTSVIPNLQVTEKAAIVIPIVVTVLTTLKSWLTNHA